MVKVYGNDQIHLQPTVIIILSRIVSCFNNLDRPSTKKRTDKHTRLQTSVMREVCLFAAHVCGPARGSQRCHLPRDAILLDLPYHILARRMAANQTCKFVGRVPIITKKCVAIMKSAYIEIHVTRGG